MKKRIVASWVNTNASASSGYYNSFSIALFDNGHREYYALCGTICGGMQTECTNDAEAIASVESMITDGRLKNFVRDDTLTLHTGQDEHGVISIQTMNGKLSIKRKMVMKLIAELKQFVPTKSEIRQTKEVLALMSTAEEKTFLLDAFFPGQLL